MRVDGPWRRDPGAQRLLALLAGAGYRALFVGGCVRDALLGRPVGDVDIATDALPEAVVAMAEADGLRVVPTGLAHGTVTVITEGEAHEVTTFRRDLETDGRRARVGWTADLLEDARRRDFTMNALYAEADGTLVDPLGGLVDLQARRVRFVGDPAERIAEDHLRILRFFRFHAWNGTGAPDAAGLAACAAAADGIDRLSRERVGKEVMRLLAAPDPAVAVAAMDRAGVLARAIPGATVRALARLVALEGGQPGDALRRLAVLGGTDPGVALRLSRSDRRELDALKRAGTGSESPAALGWRLGAGRGADAVLLRAALTGRDPEPGWQDEVARGAAAVFPLRAADLGDGLSGPELGAKLKRLEARWLASGLRAHRDSLLQSGD